MALVNFHPGTHIKFLYTNHRGKTAERHVRFDFLQVGTVEPYYMSPTVLLHCYDFDRQGHRSFDVSKIHAGSVERWASPVTDGENLAGNGLTDGG